MLGRDEVPVLDQDDDAVDALAELGGASINRGLVLSDDRLVGFLSINDLARALEARPRRRRRRRPGRSLDARPPGYSSQ
jgi:CBS domain-containing protein